MLLESLRRLCQAARTPSWLRRTVKMLKTKWCAVGLAALLSGTVSVQAQSTSRTRGQDASFGVRVLTPATDSGTPGKFALSGSTLVAQDSSAPAAKPLQSSEVAAQEPAPADEEKLGPTLPEDVKFLQSALFGDRHRDCPSALRLYGWLDAGYTYASTGPGPLTVETRENRFGNEFLFNEAALVLETPLDPTRFSLGFNA